MQDLAADQSLARPGHARIEVGDPGPSFVQRSLGNPRYAFDTAAGRYLVLCFYGSAGDARGRAAIAAAEARPDLFNDDHACFFGVSVDPADEAEGRIRTRVPGYRHFLDFDLTAARLYGVCAEAARAEDRPVALSRRWVVIDPTMRVLAVVPFLPGGEDAQIVLALLDRLHPPQRFAGIELQAPILYLPRVLEPELCARLIALYDQEGGTESGFMREIDGRTVGLLDRGHKSRKDITLTDPALIATLQERFLRKIVPQIVKAHQFHVTRMERYIVSCYAAEDGGHFAAHRDNTTAGTAHRRFAVSVNLNDDFDGGEVSFPEYGPRGFKAAPGGAVVFSCSLLHKVSKVTRGRRYAFLPFLYDDAAAKIRQRNAHLVDSPKDEAMKDGAMAPRIDFVAQIAPLRRYAQVLVRGGDGADDLVQATFLRALEKADSFRAGMNPRVWLMSVMHNLFIDQQRRNSAAQRRDEAWGAARALHTLPSGEDAARLAQLQMAFDALPEAQRNALYLVAVEGLSTAEAADVLGIPTGTVMSRVARARDALRAHENGRAATGLRIVGGRDDSG